VGIGYGISWPRIMSIGTYKLSQVVIPLNCIHQMHIFNHKWGTKYPACVLYISTAHQDKFWYRTLNCSLLSPSFHIQFIIYCYALIWPFIFSLIGRLTNSIQKSVSTNFILYTKLHYVMFYWVCKSKCCCLVQKLMSHVVTAIAALLQVKFREVLNTISLQ
jgi:hypothetical protein